MFGKALELASEKHHLVAGVTPGFYLMGDAAEQRNRNKLAGILRQLPQESLPFKPLLQAHAATLTGDLGEDVKLEAQVSFPNADLAKDGEAALKTSLYVLRQMVPRTVSKMPFEPGAVKQVRTVLEQLTSALKAATVTNDDTRVHVAIRLAADPIPLSKVAVQLRTSAERMGSINNLKQIALGTINCGDTFGFMPPAAILSKDGKPLLSWRVAILPFIEQDNLYKQFKLDEAWDGPNNKKLLERMPKIYAPVKKATKQPFTTYYQVFTGPLAPFQLKPDGKSPFGARGPRVPASFPDGTSNTLLIVEAADAVPWSKPEDLVYDEKKPVPKLGAEFQGGFIGALADGTVRFFRKDIDEKTLRALIMPADGMVIDWVAIFGKPSDSEDNSDSGSPPKEEKGPVKKP